MAEKVDLLSGSKPIPLDMLQPVRRRIPSAEEVSTPFTPAPPGATPVPPPPPFQSTFGPEQWAGRMPSQNSTSRSPQRRGPDVARRYRTLEEMYAYNSADLAADGAVLRVERLEPTKAFDLEGYRVNVSGILAFEQKPLSTPEFARKYGGRKYHVFLQVPTPQDTASGHPRMTDRAFCEFELAGEPNLSSLPIMDEEMMHQNTPFGRRLNIGRWNSGDQGPQMPQHSNDSVRAVLDFAGNVIGRSPQQGAQASMPDGAFQALQQTGQEAITTARTMASQQVEMLQRQMEELRRENARLQSSLLEDKHRPTEPVEMIKAFAALNASSRTSASSEEIQILRQQHQQEIDNIRRQHQDELTNQARFQEQMAKAQRDTYEQMAKAQRDTYDGQIRNLEQRMNDLRTDHERREQLLRDESERREREAKRDAETKSSMVQLQLESRLKDQAEAHARELRQSEKTHEFVSKSDEKLASSQLAMAQQELNKIHSELMAAKSEVDAARAERNKTLPQMLEEHQSVGAALASVAGPVGPEGGTIAERAIDGLMKVAPQLIGALGAHVKPGGAAGAAPTLAPGLGAPPQLMHAGQPQPRQMRRAAPRLVFYEGDPSAPDPRLPHGERYEPTYPVTISGAQAQVSTGVAPPPPPPPAYQPMAQPPTPVMVQSQPPPAAVEQPAPPQQAQPQPQGNVWEGLDWMGMGEDSLMQLFGGLENAYAGRNPPEQVAQELSSNIGPEMTKLFASTIDIERVIQGVGTAPMTAQTGLATKKGRAFLRHVWQELQKIAATP